MPYSDGYRPADPDQFYDHIKRQAKRERRHAIQTLMRSVFGRRGTQLNG